MTYRTLLKKLNEVAGQNPARLNDAVTIYDPEAGEYFSVASFDVAKEKDNDVLDDGHVYITMLK